jgi:hypothetical protein
MVILSTATLQVMPILLVKVRGILIVTLASVFILARAFHKVAIVIVVVNVDGFVVFVLVVMTAAFSMWISIFFL